MSSGTASRRRVRGLARHATLAAGLVSLSVGAACLFIAPSAFADGESSTTTSTPGSAGIPLGATNTDSATVTGSDVGTPPTGTVGFYACGPTATAQPCTPSGSPFDTETLDGTDNPATVTSVAFTPSAAGIWCFAAVYSGDSNYAGSNDETTDECFTVFGSSTKSTPGSTSITLGTTDTDSAAVTGSDSGTDPTGTVAFYACGPTGSKTSCTPSGSPFDTEMLDGTDNPSTVTSVSFTPTAAGYWCFAAVYSGDSNYPASNDETTTECVLVKEASSTTVSKPSSSGVVIGHNAIDTATVTGNATLGAPTGSVTFYECGPSPAGQACTVQVNNVGTTALTPGSGDTSTARSPAFVPTTAGIYCFGAYYSGDSNYLNSNDTSTDECFQAGSAPKVTSFTPTSGAPGKKVTIKGTNLKGATSVSFDGTAATILTDSATKITVDVPSGAKSGQIKVVTAFGTATSKSKFKVT